LRRLIEAVRASHPELAKKNHSETKNKVLNSTTGPGEMQKILGEANSEVLLVEYPAINQQLALPGTLVTFEDRYRPKFSKEEVYGRMDPIVSYQNTSRSITIGWEINFADGDVEWAYAALGDMAKMMYPVYHDANFDRPGTGTLVAAPLLRFSMITPNGGKPGILQGAQLNGILGAVDTFDFMKMTANKGNFNMIRQPGSGLAGVILPINLMVTFSFTVLHEGAKVGWVWSKQHDTTEHPDDPDAAVRVTAGDTRLTFGQGPGYPYHMGTSLDTSKGVSVQREGREESSNRDLNEERQTLGSLTGAGADSLIG
jgi:hypothetical protein